MRVNIRFAYILQNFIFIDGNGKECFVLREMEKKFSRTIEYTIKKFRLLRRKVSTEISWSRMQLKASER